MNDAYERDRKAKLAEWAEYVDSHEERLAEAKERLGDKYVFAPVNSPRKGSYHPITGHRIIT